MDNHISAEDTAGVTQKSRLAQALLDSSLTYNESLCVISAAYTVKKQLSDELAKDTCPKMFDDVMQRMVDTLAQLLEF